MKAQFSHEVFASFYLWFENHLSSSDLAAYTSNVNNKFNYSNAILKSFFSTKHFIGSADLDFLRYLSEAKNSVKVLLDIVFTSNNNVGVIDIKIDNVRFKKTADPYLGKTVFKLIKLIISKKYSKIDNLLEKELKKTQKEKSAMYIVYYSTPTTVRSAWASSTRTSA
jgi:hypothetical protein